MLISIQSIIQRTSILKQINAKTFVAKIENFVKQLLLKLALNNLSYHNTLI